MIGNALDASTFAAAIPAGATFVHLIGTPHPNPSKAAEFERVDLASIRAAVEAAQRGGVQHFVYVSVAHPAPIMKAYIAVRMQGEALVRASGIRATILRPWYILGPGHRWPYALIPLYAAMRAIPSTRDRALRLGLVTRRDMIAALVRAVESPPSDETARTVEVPEYPRRRGVATISLLNGSRGRFAARSLRNSRSARRRRHGRGLSRPRPALKREVAIKVLPPVLAADPDRLARFQREAEVLASLNHPHIAAIYGLEESSGDARRS